LKIEPTETQQDSDLGAMIQTVHHFLCEEEAKSPENPDMEVVLRKATALFDGGFVAGGLLGNGSSFVMRDKHGIRPAYYYQDEEIVVAASERPAILTSFNVPLSEVQELEPGHALLVEPEGAVKI